MKFQNRFNRLLIEATESDGGGGAAEPAGNTDTFSGGEEDISFSDNDEPLFDNGGDAFADLGLNAKDYGLEDGEKPEASEEESQGSDELEKEAGQATDEKSFIDFANSIGAVHGGNPLKIESKDQLKELVQKGYDYTQKTQALSEDRKVLESERVEAQKHIEAAVENLNQSVHQHNKQLRDLQQWAHAIKELEADAPDILAEVQAAFGRAGKHFDNPVFNQQFAELTKRLEDTEKKLASREDKVILDGFDAEMNKLSATEQSWKELGVTIDRAKVKERWGNTGLPVEEVIGSMYGMQVAKALESKTKVAQVKAKVAAKPVGASGKARTGGTKTPQIDPKLSGMALARELFKHYSN